jgi:hypothetical protein
LTPVKILIKNLCEKVFLILDIILAVFCFFIGAGIFLVSMMGEINQPLIGLTLIVASVFYLVMRSRLKETEFQVFQLSARQKNILHIFFFVLIIVTSVLWYNQLYSRPLLYFILISLLSGLIAGEIIFLTKDTQVWPILFKIFFLALVVRMGIFYNFPSIMGYDAFTHTQIADMISVTGFVPPFEISYQYVNYPILHILIAITKIMSFIPIKDAVFFSIGLISIISTLFIFIFVRQVAGPRVGLLSVLIICLTTQIIVTGITNITAGSLVLCYFLVLLSLIMHRERHINALILCQFVIFAMIITHQLTTFVVLLIFGLFALGIFLFDLVYRINRQYFKFYLFLAIFGVSMLLYWIYTPLYNNESFFKVTFGPFVDVLINGGQYGSDVLIVGQLYERPFIETLLLQTSYLILPFFAIGGIFFWISRKNAIKFSIAFTAAALFFLVYAIPFLGIRNLLTDRWMPFLIIFLGILGAAIIISSIDSVKSNTPKFVTIFAIVAIFSFLMIVVPSINKDTPFVAKDTTIRNQFTYQELGAVETIKSIDRGTIIIDPDFNSPFLVYGNDYKTGRQNSSVYSVVSFGSENELLAISNSSGLLTILRKSTLIEPVSLKASELYGDIYTRPLSVSSFATLDGAENQNLIFTNGDVTGYYSNR